MLFSSSVFLFFFLPAVLVLYYGFAWGRRRAGNAILLLVSLFFYAWGEPWFVLIMMASIAANYGFGRWAHKRITQGRSTRPVSITATACNLSLLFVFKYLGFVVENLNALGATLPVPEITLPIGISFFTFQALSYVLDVAWGTSPVQRSIFGVGLYVALFPQLIAGPIVRYETVAWELAHRRENWDDFSRGVCRFLQGLGKKVLLSNQLALVADAAFNAGGANLDAPMAWLGALCYSLQIYYDFSGYSDMGIGLGLMFGFHFLENFDHPYSARTVTDFWRRWHISLSTWFRDYLYIPLGGGRMPTKRGVLRNLFVVWLLTGIWHGANWTFLCWGLFYFLLLAAERFLGLGRGWPAWLTRTYTLLMVNFGWVLFRAEDLPAAADYLAAMFRISPRQTDLDLALFHLRDSWAVLAVAIVCAAPLWQYVNRPLGASRPDGRGCAWFVRPLYALALGTVFLAAVSFLVKGTYNPFIYFNF